MTMQTGDKTCSVNIRGQQLLLLPEHGLWWGEKHTLIVSDTHFGKPGHFRRSGIPIPGTLNDKDHDRFRYMIGEYGAERVIITGDLFHSELNREWDSFEKVISEFSDVAFILVPGNHDILSQKIYEHAGLHVSNMIMKDGPLSFIHSTEDELTEEDKEGFYIGGHIHPMYRVSGKARQSVRVPCFHLTARSLTLPSFGTFTGGHTIRPQDSDQVFLVAEGRVFDPISA